MTLPPILAFFRDAPWLDERRARAWLRILAAVQFLGLVGLVAACRHGADLRGEPLGTDFVSFWTAARLALSGAAASVYDPAAHHAAEQAFFGGNFGFYAFFYPPVFLLFCLPLGLAPYFVALVAWLAATGAAYVRVVRQIAANRFGVLPILAFPAVFVTLGHGQNALLTTALFGAGALWLGARPLLAGLAFGALCYKPQLALLLPLGLAASGRWRALIAMGLSAAALCALSFLLFGAPVWRAFIAESPLARAVLEQGLVEPEKMISLFAALRLAGGGLNLAYAAQGALSIGVALALVAALRRTNDALEQGVLIAAATLLATPFALDYDLALLALPLALLFSRARATGFLPFEKILALAAYALPAFARPLAQTFYLPLAPAILLLLFAALVRRVAPAPVWRKRIFAEEPA
ncbi:glycosyltransferase family 87 protein [uncultured Rhodoblastus sp.]|uniref:glycosyltransferase family 87 protein n=1 Tax=uncultured Rhodoblastus sp. TaxID=543037 RepID=UPI0025EFBC59|nr:glycosyltransferase family 87 protein [uncultured Rhodoblastus sp.]